jgi:hypothetical protein
MPLPPASGRLNLSSRYISEGSKARGVTSKMPKLKSAAALRPLHRRRSEIMINGGPLKGLSGSIVEDGSAKVVILVKLIKTATLIEIDRDWIDVK